MTLSLAGQRFGRLVAVKRVGYAHSGHATWLCQCDCGESNVVSTNPLRRGLTRSCGCLQREKASLSGKSRGKFNLPSTKTHGEGSNDSYTPEYTCWKNVKERCLNPRVPEWKYYGGRSIEVCDRWLNSYENFLADMGRRPSPRHSIDRIDNDGPYTPKIVDGQRTASKCLTGGLPGSGPAKQHKGVLPNDRAQRL
jgi:hypothetical protein